MLLGQCVSVTGVSQQNSSEQQEHRVDRAERLSPCARRRVGLLKLYLVIRDLRGQRSPKDDPSQVRPTASCVGKVVASCLQQEC